MNYPFLTVIKEDLKSPNTFRPLLSYCIPLLVKLYIKGETCLVAERDGEIIAVGLLQQKDFSMVSYLLNGIFKLFRYISPGN